MNRFVDKAISKINRMDRKQITAIMQGLQHDVETLECALDSLPEGIILLDAGRSVQYVNANCRTLVPLFAPPSGGTWDDEQLGDVVDSKEMCSFITQRLDGLHPTKDEFPVVWGGDVRTIRITVQKPDALEGGALVVFTDVTERNLQDAKLHQSEYLASMTTMAASVAHEIKNPLAAMKIYLDLMHRKLQKQGSVGKDEAKKYLDVLYEEIDRLNGIVVDYLFAVRPMNVVLRLNDLVPVINETVAFVKPELAQKKVTISCDFSSSVTRVAYDAEKIKQVLLNLIRNALAAMPKGGSITIRLALDGDQVALSVTDTGSGIAPENLAKIFEPYFTTKGAKGTGLGLTIVYKIMKEHHGDVNVESTVGKGTTFTLLFPVPASERLGLESAGGSIDGKSEEVSG